MVDDGESIKDAIIREVKEETGLDVISMKEVVSNAYNSAGMSDESLAVFFAVVDGEISLDYKEENEDIEVIILKREDISRFLADHDGKISLKTHLLLSIMAMQDAEKEGCYVVGSKA